MEESVRMIMPLKLYSERGRGRAKVLGHSWFHNNIFSKAKWNDLKLYDIVSRDFCVNSKQKKIAEKSRRWYQTSGLFEPNHNFLQNLIFLLFGMLFAQHIARQIVKISILLPRMFANIKKILNTNYLILKLIWTLLCWHSIMSIFRSSLFR